MEDIFNSIFKYAWLITVAIVVISTSVYFTIRLLKRKKKQKKEAKKEVLKQDIGLLDFNNLDSEELTEATKRYNLSVLRKEAASNENDVKKMILANQKLEEEKANSEAQTAYYELEKFVSLKNAGIDPKMKVDQPTRWEKFKGIFGGYKNNIHNGSWNETYWPVWAGLAAIVVVYAVIQHFLSR